MWPIWYCRLRQETSSTQLQHYFQQCTGSFEDAVLRSTEPDLTDVWITAAANDDVEASLFLFHSQTCTEPNIEMNGSRNHHYLNCGQDATGTVFFRNVFATAVEYGHARFLHFLLKEMKLRWPILDFASLITEALQMSFGYKQLCVTTVLLDHGHCLGMSFANETSVLLLFTLGDPHYSLAPYTVNKWFFYNLTLWLLERKNITYSSTPNQSTSPFLELPSEIWHSVQCYLDIPDYGKLLMVSKTFRRNIRSPLNIYTILFHFCSQHYDVLNCNEKPNFRSNTWLERRVANLCVMAGLAYENPHDDVSVRSQQFLDLTGEEEHAIALSELVPFNHPYNGHTDFAYNYLVENFGPQRHDFWWYIGD